jgi:hypothetical protein
MNPQSISKPGLVENTVPQVSKPLLLVAAARTAKECSGSAGHRPGQFDDRHANEPGRCPALH